MSHFEIFVVPNSAWTLNTGYDWERWAEKCPNVSGEEKMVQLWWSSEDADNVTAHKGPGYEIVSEFVPASWVSDLKEGESKVLTFNGGTVTVKANQSGSRYRGFGNFEDVVAMVTAS